MLLSCAQTGSQVINFLDNAASLAVSLISVLSLFPSARCVLALAFFFFFSREIPSCSDPHNICIFSSQILISALILRRIWLLVRVKSPFLQSYSRRGASGVTGRSVAGRAAEVANREFGNASMRVARPSIVREIE